MFRRIINNFLIFLFYPFTMVGAEGEDKINKEPMRAIEEEVAIEYDSEASDCPDPEKVIRLNGMIYTGNSWTIWLNNISINSESNPQEIQIGNHLIRVLKVNFEKKYVLLMIGEKEVQLDLRQEYLLEKKNKINVNSDYIFNY